ncbi:hypothetical protein N7490_010311, partial [Penicillium lividum]
VPRFIQSFTQTPKEMFRIKMGISVRLRGHPGPVRPQRSFDLLTTAGKVILKALDPDNYYWPNGASMRPNSRSQQWLVRIAKGSPIYVFSVPAGTILPDDLILVHEFKDHYSLQARKEMTVEELNTKINDFLATKGQRFTKKEWMQLYPRATETL